MIWRVPVSIVLWLARIAIFVPLAVLGLPIVYLLASQALCWPTRSKRFPDRILLKFPHAFALYDNDEDGVDGIRGGDPAQQWWADKTAGWSPLRRIFVWSALRNPVDGLRWVPLLNPLIDPAKVRFVGMDHEPAKGEGGWYFAWLSGTAYSCIRYETKRWRFWLGNKIKPEDRHGLPEWDVRRIRCDFAIQLKRIT